jgi:hypothetical protein
MSWLPLRKYEHERMPKTVTLAYFKVISQQLPAWIQETTEKPQLKQPTFGPKTEPGNSQVRNGTTNNSIKMTCVTNSGV